MATSGWIGVDLDGTLAHYDGWVSTDHIGAPVPAMVERVKGWLQADYTVKVFTARVSDGRIETRQRIQDWTEEHIGVRLEVTNVKDFKMIQLWDDRCVQVVTNTGQPVDAEPLVSLVPNSAWRVDLDNTGRDR